MRKQSLLKTMLLLCALIVGSSSAWADAPYKTLTFSKLTTTEVSSYTASWEETVGDDTWTITNFNNNKWGWKTSDDLLYVIKCGRKRTGSSPNYTYTPSVATITTGAAIDKAITKVVVTLTAIKQNDINSIKLYVASDEDFTEDLQTISATIPSKEGDLQIDVTTPTADMFYQLEIDTKGESTSNGHTALSKVTYYYYDAPAYTITASSNDTSMGSVSLSGSTITATPNSGYRVKAGDDGYTVTSGTATVVNNGDNTFSVTPTSNCSITINFEAIPTYTVSWSVNGTVIDTDDVSEGDNITFTEPTSGIPEGYVFKGWSATEILVPQSTAPTYVTSAKCTEAVTYYAVIALATEAIVETLSQKLTYDTSDDYPWTIGGSTTDKSGYTLFHTGGYVKSASFDLSKLCKVKVYGGTYGGSTTYKTFTIGDGTNVWKEGELTGTNNGKEHTFTEGTALTGTGELYITSTCGTASNTGIRMSKVEIFTMEPGTTYSDYCTTIPSVSVTITDTGYNTFSCNSPVNLSSLNGATAYVATGVEDGMVKLVNTTAKVPAGTGLFIKGTAGVAYTINVTSADDAEEPEANLLVGVPNGETIGKAADGEYNYVFGWTEVSNPGFYLINATSATLPAGKAYLHTTSALTADLSRLGIILDDGEVTGISATLMNNETMSNEYFDLQGRRVANPTKGLYIVNGKKVVIK